MNHCITYTYTQHKYNSRHLHLSTYPSQHTSTRTQPLPCLEWGKPAVILHQVIPKPRNAAPQCGCRVHPPPLSLFYFSHYSLRFFLTTTLHLHIATTPPPSSTTHLLMFPFFYFPPLLHTHKCLFHIGAILIRCNLTALFYYNLWI